MKSFLGTESQASAEVLLGNKTLFQQPLATSY